jgi:hypothetical protein
VLTYQQGAWRYAVPPFATHCNQWEADVIPIVCDSSRAGYVLIHYGKFANDSISTETESVPLKLATAHLLARQVRKPRLR